MYNLNYTMQAQRLARDARLILPLLAAIPDKNSEFHSPPLVQLTQQKRRLVEELAHLTEANKLADTMWRSTNALEKNGTQVAVIASAVNVLRAIDELHTSIALKSDGLTLLRSAQQHLSGILGKHKPFMDEIATLLETSQDEFLAKDGRGCIAPAAIVGGLCSLAATAGLQVVKVHIPASVDIMESGVILAGVAGSFATMGRYVGMQNIIADLRSRANEEGISIKFPEGNKQTASNGRSR